jgi:hypothetical protein
LVKRGKVRPKRIHIDGSRYNERLNAKTEGSKRIHWVARVGIIVSLVGGPRRRDARYDGLLFID